MGFVYVFWSLGGCLLLPLVLTQRTTLVLDRRSGFLMVTWATLWGGMRESRSYRLDTIRTVLLCDMRRTSKDDLDGTNDTTLFVPTLHERQLMLELVDGDQRPLLPSGHTSGLLGCGVGARLAAALGVPFSKCAVQLTE